MTHEKLLLLFDIYLFRKIFQFYGKVIKIYFNIIKY